MNIDEKIAELAIAHKAIIEANPLIGTIKWEIDKIPYAVFDEWRKRKNSERVKLGDEGRYISETSIGNRMFMLLQSWDLGIERMELHLASVPVKFKHTYEAIEEISASAE